MGVLVHRDLKGTRATLAHKVFRVCRARRVSKGTRGIRVQPGRGDRKDPKARKLRKAELDRRVSAGTTAIRERKEFQVTKAVLGHPERMGRRGRKEKLSRVIKALREQPELRDLKETLEDPRVHRELKEF